jgi:glycosyltransferase involved in cell wall biosynthesis
LFREHPYRRVAQALERAVARDATTVAMPTRTWAEHYGATWNTDVVVLPNGFDTRLPGRQAPERPTLTYLGSYLPGEHDLSTLWQALALLRARSPDGAPRIRFVGRLPAALRDEIEAAGLSDLLEPTGFISHEDAMRELMSASVLIASGVPGDEPRQRGWIPAKLFEYLASGLPIVYVADPSTEAAALVSGHPAAHVVAPGNVEGALAAVQTALREDPQERDVSHLSREAGARRLAQILDQLVQR